MGDDRDASTARNLTVADAVLRRPEDVTPSSLTSLLRASGAIIDGAEVTAVEIEPVGTGQMADTVRMAITTEPADVLPATLVAKFASADEQSHATGQALRAYEVEVLFYAEVAPRVGARVPNAYAAALDRDEAWFTLVLEDMGAAAQGDQIAGCDEEVARRCLVELASLHASCWQDPTLESLEWLNRSSPESEAFTAALVTGVFPGFLERYDGQLTDVEVDLLEEYVPKMVDWMSLRRGPRTVVHGDFRLDNLLFTDDDHRPVTVDFQTVSWAMAAQDLAYFLGSCLPVEVRRAHEESLVAGYHADLIAGGVEDYSLDELWEDYRIESLNGLVMAVGASMLVKRTDRGDEMFLTNARRHAAHALDLEAMEIVRGAR